MVSIISFYEGEIDPYKQILDDIRLAYPNVLMFRVPTDVNTALTRLYDIKTKPTMIFFSGSSEHNRCEGETSRDDVFSILRELFNSEDDGEWN
jgi:uncharacterized SAM-dependent methyltransferase